MEDCFVSFRKSKHESKAMKKYNKYAVRIVIILLTELEPLHSPPIALRDPGHEEEGKSRASQAE